MPLSETDKRVGMKVADAFSPAEFARIFEISDDRSNVVDVAEYPGSPMPGVVSYSTVGLSASPLMDGETEMPFGLEICGAAGSGYDRFPHILATAAFEVLGGGFVYPDRILGGAVAAHYPDLEMKHLLFMTPFLWDERLRAFDAGGRQVAWVQAVPISDGELDLALRTSVDRMTDLLQERGADPTDLGRPSAV